MPCHSSDAMTLVQTWWSAIAATTTTPAVACRLHLTYLMPLAAKFFSTRRETVVIRTVTEFLIFRLYEN